MSLPKRSEQQRLFHEAGDSLERRFKSNWTKAVNEWGEAPNTKKAMRSFARGDIDANEFINQVGRTLDTLPDSLRAGIRVVQTRGYNITADMLKLDRVKNAADWGDTYAADRIGNITKNTREAIRSFVGGSVREGVPVSTLAREIQSVLALDPKFAQAAVNFRNGMKALEIKPGTADTQTEKYIARAARVRANTIARTETMAALANGQRVALSAAQRAGLLDPSSQMVWIAAPGCCSKCTSINGKTADVGFAWMIDGVAVLNPPLHPNCRCTIGVS